VSWQTGPDRCLGRFETNCVQSAACTKASAYTATQAHDAPRAEFGFGPECNTYQLVGVVVSGKYALPIKKPRETRGVVPYLLEIAYEMPMILPTLHLNPSVFNLD